MSDNNEIPDNDMQEVIREMAAVDKRCNWDKTFTDPDDPTNTMYYPCTFQHCHECKHQVLLFTN